MSEENQELIHEADVAVYQAKLQGRNRVVMAADVPHYIKLDTMTPEDRLETPNMATFVPRPQFNGSISESGPQQSAEIGNDSDGSADRIKHLCES